MSVASYITSIEASRNVIRNKLIELGIATSNDKLDRLAAAIENLVNHGAVTVTVKEGDTYTIPAGYHNGNGTVSGVAGGGNYNLQTKTATPTKKQQSIAPDSGYYGLSGVTIAPIPDAYQDVSSVTALPGEVLSGKVYVTADGTVTAGEMLNLGAVNKTIDVTTITYTIPAGYHNGEGKVQIVLETKTATPTKAQQEFVPSAGKVLSKVVVNPIPDQYQDVTPVTATAAAVLEGTIFVDKTGAQIEGSMVNQGAIAATIDGLTTSVYTIPAGSHNGEGTVSLTDDIEKALEAI